MNVRGVKVEERVLSSLLRSFHEASLPSKVVIATALYITANFGRVSEEFLEKAKNAWTKAVRAELDLEEIVGLYRAGLADYTHELDNYKDVVEFIAVALGEALAKMKIGVRE